MPRVRNVYVSGGVLLAGVAIIGTLLYLDFFGLFRPDDLSRWEATGPPSFSEPEEDLFGMEDLEEFLGEFDEDLAAMMKEGPAAYTSEQVERWVEELLPIVERVCEPARH